MDDQDSHDVTPEITQVPERIPFQPIHDWDTAYTIYRTEGITLRELSERTGIGYEVIRNKASQDKWSLKRRLEQEDASEVWQLKLMHTFLKHADLIAKANPTDIDELHKLMAAAKAHVDAGKTVFGLEGDQKTGNTLVQVNVAASNTARSIRSKSTE